MKSNTTTKQTGYVSSTTKWKQMEKDGNFYIFFPPFSLFFFFFPQEDLFVLSSKCGEMEAGMCGGNNLNWNLLHGFEEQHKLLHLYVSYFEHFVFMYFMSSLEELDEYKMVF